MWPASFDDLQSKPSFLINLESAKHRLEVTKERLRTAGFKNITRFVAVDGTDTQVISSQLGKPFSKASVRLDLAYNPGAIGCFISHLSIWSHMLQNNIPFANIFEDDICFHSNFRELAALYYEETPMNWDMIYMGCELTTNVGPLLMRRFHLGNTKNITTHPAYCLHAYSISLSAVKKLLSYLYSTDLLTPVDDLITRVMSLPTPPLIWYCWDARHYPTQLPDTHSHPISTPYKAGNHGLVLQDATYESSITTTDYYTEFGTISFITWEQQNFSRPAKAVALYE